MVLQCFTLSLKTVIITINSNVNRWSVVFRQLTAVNIVLALHRDGRKVLTVAPVRRSLKVMELSRIDRLPITSYIKVPQ